MGLTIKENITGNHKEFCTRFFRLCFSMTLHVIYTSIFFIFTLFFWGGIWRKREICRTPKIHAVKARNIGDISIAAD